MGVEYSKKGLGLLNTFNSDDLEESYNLKDCLKEEAIFCQFMASGVAATINNELTSNQIFVYSEDMLKNIASKMPVGVDTIFYPEMNFGFSKNAQSIIESLVNDKHVKVVLKRLSVVTIATDGQYNYQSRRDYDGGWGIGVAAGNHDLYREHLEDARGLVDFFLFTPKDCPKIEKNMNIEIQTQMQLDSKRFLEANKNIVIEDNNILKNGDAPFSNKHHAVLVQEYA